MQLPGNTRQLVRDAVRAAPHCGIELRRLFGDSAKVNSLSKPELLSLARALSVDVAAIVAASVRGNALADSSRLSRDGAALGTGDEREDEAEKEETQDGAAPPFDLTHAAHDVRRLVARAMAEGDFTQADTVIADLIAASRKPPEIKIVTRTVDASSGAMVNPAGPAAPLEVASVTTLAKLFGITGPGASRKIQVFHPSAATPEIDARYVWPPNVTHAAVASLARGRNIWLYGPAGTGKSSFAEQLAARTGRPFCLIPCDDTTEAPELVGMTVPHQGSVRWQDGVLTAAMRIPGTIILVDEPTVARPGALMVLQSVLASGLLSVKETGEVVRAAPGVRFLVADNTNGTGGGAAEGYEGTRRLNRATLDRFSLHLKLDFMPPDAEAAALVAHTSCTAELAALLVSCAVLTRAAKVSHSLGLRRLIAWAEALTDGLEARYAFETAVLNSATRDDREPIEQACALGLDRSAIKLALDGHVAPAPAAPVTPAYRSGAAADFAA